MKPSALLSLDSRFSLFPAPLTPVGGDGVMAPDTLGPLGLPSSHNTKERMQVPRKLAHLLYENPAKMGKTVNASMAGCSWACVVGSQDIPSVTILGPLLERLKAAITDEISLDPEALSRAYDSMRGTLFGKVLGDPEVQTEVPIPQPQGEEKERDYGSWMRPDQEWKGRGRGRGRGLVTGQRLERSSGASEKVTCAPAADQNQNSGTSEKITCAPVTCHVTSMPSVEQVSTPEDHVTVLPHVEETVKCHDEETKRGRTIKQLSRDSFNRGRGGSRPASLVRSRASRERSSERQHTPVTDSLPTKPHEMTQPNRRKTLIRGSGLKQDLDENEI
ncbi:hypothetical protein J5N97_016363 [Dioscorea zingiberensis]|uniref:Uncharacterized protein n=1 Tax=Dioscorea zingiberensis TaxID=325984 RepID=A0A9D5CJ74_9LILI|nr:hypothetical protein J5N97_016363 [Dioscorea zingiberensis]